MGWLLMLVIGLAMIAFILGDLSDSGSALFNRSKMRVGEIAGEAVEYTDFSDRIEYYKSVHRMMSGTENLSEADIDAAESEAWQNLISEIIMEPNLETLGLTISEGEQIDMVSGAYISPIISTVFTNPQTGLFDRTILSNFVSNIDYDPTGGVALLWEYFKTSMGQERTSSKYMTLISKGMYVTDVEVAQAVANSAKYYDASYIVENYASIADSTIKVSTADIKQYYDLHRNSFTSTAVRDIEYVIFDVLPSQSDYADAAKTIESMAIEFERSESPMQYAQLNSHRTPDNFYYAESELSGALAILSAKGDTESVEGPTLNSNVYTMSRIADIKMSPDSVGAKHILLMPTATEQADSIIRAIKSGASFAELSVQYSLDPTAEINGGDLGNFSPELMISEISDAVVASRVGDLYTVQTQYGLHVIQTTYKSTPVKKTQVATVTFEVEPSAVTQQDIYSKASQFITESGGSLDNFNAAVNSSSLSKRVARVRSTDSNVTGFTNSRELVRWAYTQNEGDVSEIMEIDGDYVIAALTSVQEDGVAPMDKVSADIIPLVRQQKKGEMLAAKMQGSSLDQVASSLGSEVSSVDGVIFDSYYLDGVGMEPLFIGAVTAAKEGALSKPVQGTSGVFLFTVTASEDVTYASTEDEEKVRLQALSESYVTERVTQALMLKAGIKDYRVRFF